MYVWLHKHPLNISGKLIYKGDQFTADNVDTKNLQWYIDNKYTEQIVEKSKSGKRKKNEVTEGIDDIL